MADLSTVPELFLAPCPVCGYDNEIFVSRAELDRNNGLFGTITCARGSARMARPGDSLRVPDPSQFCGVKFVVFVE